MADGESGIPGMPLPEDERDRECLLRSRGQPSVVTSFGRRTTRAQLRGLSTGFLG